MQNAECKIEVFPLEIRPRSGHLHFAFCIYHSAFFRIASAVRMPSMAADMMPPA